MQRRLSEYGTCFPSPVTPFYPQLILRIVPAMDICPSFRGVFVFGFALDPGEILVQGGVERIAPAK